MPTIPGAEGPHLDYRIPPPLLAFLHEAYPSWNLSDVSSHPNLIAAFPSRDIAWRIVNALQAGDIVGTGIGEPQGDALCWHIFMWPRRPSDYLPGGPKGPGPRRPPPPGTPHPPVWVQMRISVLGPYAALRWYRGSALPTDDVRGPLESVLMDLAHRDHLELLPREVLWCPIAGMKGRRQGLTRLAPNVEEALFGRT